MNEKTAQPYASLRQWLPIVLALGLSTFLVLFDVTAVVVAMPALAKDMGVGVSGLAWVIDAYSLAFTAMLLASGALADRFGRRRCMLAGNAMFLAASIACGLAPNAPMLLAARAAQGLGAAFMATGGIALIGTAFSDATERSRAFGVTGTIAGVAMALGPALGGFLTAWFGWRWIFYANVPFCLALAWAVPRLVAESRGQSGQRLDIVGVSLLTISLVLAVDALLRHDGSALLRASCLGGGLLMAAIFLWQQRRSAHPLLDPRVFATTAMAGVVTLLTMLQFGYWGVVVYLPLFLNASLAMSIDAAGFILLAATSPMLLVPIIGGRLATHWGWRRLFGVAFGLIALGDAFLVIATTMLPDIAARQAATIAGMVIAGFGMAFANPQFSAVALALAPLNQVGMASAMTMVVRQAGFAISIAVFGLVLGTGNSAADFATAFTLAMAAALLGMGAAIVALPQKAAP
jgi:EmrB/QacA subfamily drug resistance transporter